MKLESRTNENIVFSDEKERFVFVDMGGYVGYQSRNWYEEAPKCWKLMFYDEKKEEAPIHIEALVDSLGNYSRIMVCKEEMKRVLFLNNNFVEEDKVFQGEEDMMLHGKEFVAYENPYLKKTNPNVDDYLKEKQTFTSEEGEVYEGDVINNHHILRFLIASKELSKSIQGEDLEQGKTR